MKNVFKVADACFVNYSSFQDRIFYKSNIRRETTCHKDEIDSAEQRHSEGKMVTKQKHLMEIYSEMQKHFQTLNSDLLSTTKENERDMFDHRNQQFSTILVAATIMLSALVAVLAQGVLHEDSQKNAVLVIVYSVSNSLSMSFLFICDVFCMGVLWRASQFMKNRSRSHYGYLDKAIKKTKDMVRSIRGVKDRSMSSSVPGSSRNASHHDSDNSNDDYGSCRNIGNHRSSPQNPRIRDSKRRLISHMRDKAVAEEFSLHETEVHRYLEEREGIIDGSAYILSGSEDDNTQMKSFESFWQESCSFYANMAVLMFYAGSASLIFANGTFVSSTFLFRYRSISGGAITFIIIFCTLPLAALLLVYLRYIEVIPMDLDEAEETKGQGLCRGAEAGQPSILRCMLTSLQYPYHTCRGIYRRFNGNYSEISSEDLHRDEFDRGIRMGVPRGGGRISSTIAFGTDPDLCGSTDVSSINSGSTHSSVQRLDISPRNYGSSLTT